MEAGDVEQLAFEFYERVKCDPSEPVSPFKLARLFLGADAIERTGSLISSPAATFVINGKRKIALRRQIPIEYAAFYVGHELGHAILDELGYHEADTEQICDLFGGALMAPRPAIHRLHRALGFDLAAIADEVGSTETWAALRIGEILRVPLVTLAPLRVRVRGPEAWEWPDEDTLRRWAKNPPKGLARTRLTDDPRRVVLVAEDPDNVDQTG